MLWLLWLFLFVKIPAFALDATPSATIIINKFQYNPPLDKNEWVELFNTTDVEIDLNGWLLVDESNTKKYLTGKKIGGKSFLTYDDGKSWLNNDFDTLFLKIGDSIVDQVKYKITSKKITINDVLLNDEYSDFKGKWIGRSDIGSSSWQIFSDTDGPIGGAINYFDGYKNIIEKINIGITVANDISGIGLTAVITKMANLNNNNCDNFVVDIGNSLVDGRCYRYEYLTTDGVGNTTTFISNSIVKFDTTKPILSIGNAFRNILKLKSVFGGVDPESGILKYKYGLSNTNCSTTILPTDWSYIYNSILNIGYSGQPYSIYGVAINNALLESDSNCIDFVIDIVAPKINNQTNPESGIYKIGDILNFNFEFNEDIEINSNKYFVNLNTGKANFINKTGNILNFEYEVAEGEITNNLLIGETIIITNGGQITDTAGNDANLVINNLDNGIIIDGIKPTIGLIGDTYVEIPQFGSYLDLGVTISDGTVTVDNNVNTMLGGMYEVKYVVVDIAGNENSIKRNVKVVDTTAPTINQLSINNLELSVNSDENGYVEWEGKCDSENKNIVSGDNLIEIKNNGDGIYNDCKIRAWDKWGNVGEWQMIDSFVVDTTPPLISFINSSQTEINITANENLKNCNMEKEKLLSGDFETGNIDGWQGDFVMDDLHFANGSKSAKSPALINSDLVEKSIWQEINLESDGVLSFWWRVSSEKDWDYLKFYIDGILIDKISGEVSWQEVKYNLEVGIHVIKFTYSKDYSGESGEDAGWIDNVKIDGGGNIVAMDVLENNAYAKLNNLVGGSSKYKVNCIDMYENKSNIIERIIVKDIEKNNNSTPMPTPYKIVKTSAVVPTIKIVKTSTTKKSATVLGIATTPTPNPTITSPPTTKLKTNIPWGEIKFWMLGMMALSTTSGVILLDKKKN